MTEPLFTAGGLAARTLSAEDAAAAREFFEACDGSEDLTCGLPVAAAAGTSVAETIEPDLRIGVFEGPDPAGVLEALRDVPDPGWWTIGLLMVETGRRGAHRGREVLEAFASWAEAQGTVGLVVGVPSGPGESFWRSAGFSEHPGGATAAGPGELVELRRALGPA